MRHAGLKLACWAVALLLVPAVASAAGDDRVATVRNADPDGVADYWTPERLAAARPMPLGEAFGGPVEPPFWAPPGPAREQSGTLPWGVREEFAPEQGPMAGGPAGINGGAVWYTYPPPFTSSVLRAQAFRFPNSTLGKLFFDDIFGNSFVCSGAAVVCTGDQDLVMTAGHCCSDGAGTFHTNFQFIPACNKVGCAVQPFGVWNWQQVTVLTAWHTGGDLARDVCWMKVAPNGAGQELHQLVGALGFSWNQPQPIHYFATGWPAAPPFTGWKSTFAAASTAEMDGAFTPNTVGIGNDMTGGSSGGAWIKNYKQLPSPKIYWNGLNSYKYVSPAMPLEMFGPYVDTLIHDVKAGTSVNCP